MIPVAAGFHHRHWRRGGASAQSDRHASVAPTGPQIDATVSEAEFSGNPSPCPLTLPNFWSGKAHKSKTLQKHGCKFLNANTLYLQSPTAATAAGLFHCRFRQEQLQHGDATVTQTL